MLKVFKFKEFILNKDRLAALVFIFFVCFFLKVSFSYPGGTAWWPQVLLGLLFLFCFILLIKPGKTVSATSLPKHRLILQVGASVTYLCCINILGYFVSTLGFLLFMPPMLGIRKKKLILVSSALVFGFVYLIFWRFLKVPLPRGVLF